MHSRSLLVLAALVALGATATDNAFLLAVVRRDGVLIPFANFDGKRWRNDWPSPNLPNAREIPLTLRDVPRRWGGNADLAHWIFWPPGGEPRPVQAQAPTWVQSQCLTTIGLKTDHQPAGLVPPPVVQPHPKDGLATTGGAAVEPIEIRTDDAPEWTEFVRYFQSAVAPAEEAVIAMHRRTSGWRHPVPIAMRKLSPFGLEALYRAPADRPGRYAYFFEGTKRYPMPRKAEEESSCDLVTFVSGWIVRDADSSKTSMNVRAIVTYCDLMNVEVMFPLGLLRVGEHLLWAVQWSGWGLERYELIEIEPRRVRIVFQTPGGSC